VWRSKSKIFDSRKRAPFDGEWAASASFKIDRAAWGSIYGSPRYFRCLPGHLVRENVSLSVTLVGS